MINQLSKQIEIRNGYISARRKSNKGDFRLHWHDFFELEYIVSGTGKYIIDSEVYNITPGMVFFTSPTSFHQLCDTDITLYTVMFTMYACNNELLKSLCLNSSYRVFKANEKSQIFLESVLDELVNHLSNKTFATCMLDSILAKLDTESNNHSSNPISVVNQAMLFIINNFRSELTLEDVAKYAGYTPTYFSRIFKEETGVNFKEYLNNMRFEYAEKLLKHTDMNTTQICGECGFNDYANFARHFKLHFGMSPNQYRKITQLPDTPSVCI